MWGNLFARLKHCLKSGSEGNPNANLAEDATGKAPEHSHRRSTDLDDNLTELAAPPPVQNPREAHWYRKDFLEETLSHEQ